MNATYETRGIKRSCGMRRDKKEQKDGQQLLLYMSFHTQIIFSSHLGITFSQRAKLRRAVQDVGKGNQNSFKRK